MGAHKTDKKQPHPSLGIIRLDYDYPPAKGDIDSPATFPYDVYYKVVPGLTFEMCQSGKMTKQVEERFKSSIRWLAEEKHVCAITGDCGFMLQFQTLARKITDIQVFMSPLCQLPGVMSAYSSRDQIIIMTSNGKSLNTAKLCDLVRRHCGVDTHEKRYNVVCCSDIDGFEAVALGEKVDTKKVEPGVVKKAIGAVARFPHSKAILLECTELPPYADAIRNATGLPVYDAITACNFYISGFQDDVRFGSSNWQHKWDRQQEKYGFGDNLSEEEKAELVNRSHLTSHLKSETDR